MNERWLIVGADGLLGGALRRSWRQSGRLVAATSFLTLADGEEVIHFDLAQPEATWPALPRCSAAVVCAAITSLEQCRRDPAATRRVNVTQTVKLAQRLADQGCFVVFISSNLVFDGSKPRRHPEEPVGPKTEYGRQKAEAETGLATLGNRAAIVRLTKVFHPHMPLIRGWMDSLEQGKVVHPFSNLMCSPISLAATIQTISTVTENQLGGIWQLSASADVSYADIARHLALRRGFDLNLVQPVACGEGTLEHLPRHTTVDASRSHDELGFEIPDPMTVLDQVLFHEDRQP